MPGGLTSQALHRTADADRGDDSPAGVAHRSADRGDTGFPLFDALRHIGALQHATSRTTIQRKQCALRDDPAQAVGGFEGDDAAPSIRVGDVELHALARVVAQRREHGASDLRQRELLLRGARQTNQLEPEAEPSLRIAAHQPVLLEGDRQPVSRRSRQAGRFLQTGEVLRGAGQSAKDHNPFVNHPDAAYTVQERESYPKW